MYTVHRYTGEIIQYNYLGIYVHIGTWEQPEKQTLVYSETQRGGGGGDSDPFDADPDPEIKFYYLCPDSDTIPFPF